MYILFFSFPNLFSLIIIELNSENDTVDIIW